ncbi:MAG: hypothetical protein DRI90_15560 [Deltaproteobacteria bacterium]|nr:MAG: hypothetical protein DRI90_15560 [Deltaproteobacteria bacterium]
MSLAVVLAGAVALASLSYDPSAPAAAPKTAVLLVVGLAALALSLPTTIRSRRLALTTGGAGWLLLCAWGLLTLAWADHPQVGDLAIWLGGGAVLLRVSRLDAEEVRVAAGWAGVAVGSGSSVALAIQAALGARGLALHGLHGNPNWLGLVLATTLPLQLDRLASEGARRTLRWWALTGSVALTAAALLLSGSRVGWLALAVVALVCGRGPIRWWVTSLVGAALTYALVAGDLAQSLGGRWWLWRTSVNAALTGLPWGHGMGGFPHAFLDAQGARLASWSPEQAALRFENATTAHQEWLQLLCEGGLLAPALLLAVLVLSFLQLRRRWRAGAATVLAVAVCTLGDAPLRQPAVIAILCLVLAATPRLQPRRGDLVLAVATLVAVAVLLPTAASSWLGARRLTAARELPLADRLARLGAAVKAEPQSGELALALGLAHLEVGEPQAALADLERSRGLLANLGTDVAIGNAHLQLGATAAAIVAYRRALRRHPALFRAHANLAEALRIAGDLDQAVHHLAVARELMPNHPKLLQTAERLRRDQIDAATQ